MATGPKGGAGGEIRFGEHLTATMQLVRSLVTSGEQRNQREFDERDEEGVDLDRTGARATEEEQRQRRETREEHEPGDRVAEEQVEKLERHQKIIHQKRASTPAKK